MLQMNHILKQCGTALGFVLLFSLAGAVLQLVLPLYMIQVFDRVLSSASMPTLISLSGVAIFCLVFLAAFEGLRTSVLTQADAWLDNTMQPILFKAGLRAQVAGDFNAAGSAQSDLMDFRSFWTNQPVISLIDAVLAPFFLFIIYIMSPILALVAVGGIIGLVILSILNEFAVRDPLNNSTMLSRIVNGQLGSITRNAEIIQTLGLSDSLYEAVDEHRLASRSAGMKARGRLGTFSSIAKFYRFAIQIAMIGTGAYLVLQSQITPGAMFAGNILMARALAPFEQMMTSWKASVAARTAFSKLNEFLAKYHVISQPMNYPRPKGEMIINGVTHKLPGMNRPVLVNISLKIEAGNVLGIMGPSGCGKSTLARLMLGISPATAGAITLDGVDVAKWNRADIGQYLGYLPQDVEIFPGTIRQNITRFSDDVTDEQVIEVAKLVGIHEMVADMAEGYHTRIGDGGVRLSGGQQQRVALARAFFGDPAFIVLDEPNSNLDKEGEQALANAIQTMKAKGATIAVIMHNTTLLPIVDTLLVFQKNGSAMYGKRDAVLQKLQGGNVTPLETRTNK